MSLKKMAVLVVACGLLVFPQLAAAEDSFIKIGFSGDATLTQYNARANSSYYAVGSVDGAAVQDRDGNTWQGYGVGAIAFEPTSDVTATSVQNVVRSVVFTYGTTPGVSITFAPGIDVNAAVHKMGIVTSGLTPGFDITPGNLPPSSYTVSGQIATGQTLTIDTVATINSSTTPVDIKLTFQNFVTPANITMGNFYVWGRSYGLAGTTQTASPELSSLQMYTTTDNFANNSILTATFDEPVRINQTPSEAANRQKINAVLVKAPHSTDPQKIAVLDAILGAVSTGTPDRMVTMGEVTAAILQFTGSAHDVAIDLNGTSTYLAVTDGGPFTTVIPPPVTPPADNTPITGDTTIPTGSTVTGNTISAGATVTNNGTMVNPTNNGTIAGGTLSGTVTNNGTVSNVTLGEGTTVTGGTVTGTLTGSGTGATLTDAVIDATTITGNVTIGSGCTITSSSAAANPGIDLTAAVTGNNDRISLNAPILADPATGTALSLRDLLRNSVNTLLGDSSCDVQEDVRGNGHIGAQNLGNIQLPGRITEVETTDQPDGADFDDDGNLVIRISGIAMTVTPTSQNADAFEAALAALNLAAEESSYGVVSITLPGVGRIALRFAGFSVLPATASIAQAGASFSLVGDPSNPETYHLVAVYPDGTSQPMLPFIHDLAEFGQLCGANTITYRVDPINGCFELMNAAGVVFYHGIPDYLVTDPPAGTTATFVESDGDVNGDGLVDFYLVTPTGRQLVYSLPLN